MSEQRASNPEINYGGRPRLPVYDAPEVLDFTVTPELAAIVQNAPDWPSLARDYHAETARMVGELDGRADGLTIAKMRIGANLDFALVRRDAGCYEDYLEDLEFALDELEAMLRSQGHNPDENLEYVAVMLQISLRHEYSQSTGSTAEPQ